MTTPDRPPNFPYLLPRVSQTAGDALKRLQAAEPVRVSLRVVLERLILMADTEWDIAKATIPEET